MMTQVNPWGFGIQIEEIINSGDEVLNGIFELFLNHFKGRAKAKHLKNFCEKASGSELPH